MINLRTLETFYVVAQMGGFHRAAEKLHTTQPAVSARVAQLEQTLKVRLFERDKQGTYLTPKGRELLGYAERMLALRTELVVAASGRRLLGGTVQLGVSETIAHTWLSDLLKLLSREYPTITLEVNVDSSVNLASSLTDGSIDVALLMGPINVGNTQNLPVCTYRLSWIAPADLPLGPGTATLEDLSAHPIITFPRSTRTYWEIAQLFQQAGLHKVRMFANTSLSSMIRMTLDGIGIAAIPQHVAAEHISSGRLKVIDTGHELPTLPFTASFIQRADMPLNVVVAELAQQVGAAYDGRIAAGEQPSWSPQPATEENA